MSDKDIKESESHRTWGGDIRHVNRRKFVQKSSVCCLTSRNVFVSLNRLSTTSKFSGIK